MSPFIDNLTHIVLQAATTHPYDSPTILPSTLNIDHLLKRILNPHNY